MKNLLFLLLFCTTVLNSSCGVCTKKHCVNYYSVHFTGFSAGDVEGAKAISGTDSSDLRITLAEDSTYYYLDDFEIGEGNTTPLVYSFPAANKTFILSDYQFEKQTCNKCAVGSDHYTQFSGCTVNGEKQRGNIIILAR